MSNEIMRREMKGAMDAGERALSSLRNAQENKEQVSDAIIRVEQVLNELKRKM